MNGLEKGKERIEYGLDERWPTPAKWVQQPLIQLDALVVDGDVVQRSSGYAVE